MSRTLQRHTAIVATTPDDSHVWNLIGVQLKLEERGFHVHNLGACTPPETVAEAVRDLRPDLLVISTVNGHGSISVPLIMQALELYQLNRTTKIVVGGLLTTDQASADRATRELNAAGCAGVFSGEAAWQDFDEAILKSKRAA